MNPTSSCSRRSIRRKALIIGVAVLYGAVLAASAILMAGAGDGSYALFDLFFSPMSLLMSILNFFQINIDGRIWIIVTPLLWVVPGILGTITAATKRRIWLGVFLIFHYVGAMLVLLLNEPYENWRKLQEQWGFAACKMIVVFSLTIYLLGQIWLWLQLLQTREVQNHQGRIVQDDGTDS